MCFDRCAWLVLLLSACGSNLSGVWHSEPGLEPSITLMLWDNSFSLSFDGQLYAPVFLGETNQQGDQLQLIVMAVQPPRASDVCAPPEVGSSPCLAPTQSAVRYGSNQLSLELKTSTNVYQLKLARDERADNEPQWW